MIYFQLPASDLSIDPSDHRCRQPASWIMPSAQWKRVKLGLRMSKCTESCPLVVDVVFSSYSVVYLSTDGQIVYSGVDLGADKLWKEIPQSLQTGNAI